MTEAFARRGFGVRQLTLFFLLYSAENGVDHGGRARVFALRSKAAAVKVDRLSVAAPSSIFDHDDDDDDREDVVVIVTPNLNAAHDARIGASGTVAPPFTMPSGYVT